MLSWQARPVSAARVARTSGAAAGYAERDPDQNQDAAHIQNVVNLRAAAGQAAGPGVTFMRRGPQYNRHSAGERAACPSAAQCARGAAGPRQKRVRDGPRHEEMKFFFSCDGKSQQKLLNQIIRVRRRVPRPN